MAIHIYVDADACPVKDEAVRVAVRYAIPITFVSHQHMRAPVGPNVAQVVVAMGFDAADDWIVERVQPGDIVVTADIPLAARCLEKGSRALNPNGSLFDADTIGSALAIRELKAYLRETGDITGHNPSFTKRDRSQFLQAMDLLIHQSRTRRG